VASERVHSRGESEDGVCVIWMGGMAAIFCSLLVFYENCGGDVLNL